MLCCGFLGKGMGISTLSLLWLQANKIFYSVRELLRSPALFLLPCSPTTSLLFCHPAPPLLCSLALLLGSFYSFCLHCLPPCLSPSLFLLLYNIYRHDVLILNTLLVSARRPCRLEGQRAEKKPKGRGSNKATNE